MLADASISRVRISKAKPQRGPAGHLGTRTPASSHTGGGKRRRRRDIPDAGTKWSSGTVTLHRHSWRRAGAGWGGESGRGATSGRGAALGRCTSVRGGCRCGQARRWRETTMHACRWGADVGAAKLAGGGRRRCARVGEGRHVGEERRVGEGRRIGEEPFVGDGRNEERRRRRRQRKRGEAAIWGKMAKCRSERRQGLYRTPNLLSRVIFTTVTKGPLVSGRIMTRD
jgi:hypothetical protein